MKKIERNVLGLHVVTGINTVFLLLVITYLTSTRVEINRLWETVNGRTHDRYTAHDAAADKRELQRAIADIEKKFGQPDRNRYFLGIIDRVPKIHVISNALNMSKTSDVLVLSGEAIEKLAVLLTALIQAKNVTESEKEAAKTQVAELLASDEADADTTQSIVNKLNALIETASAAAPATV